MRKPRAARRARDSRVCVRVAPAVPGRTLTKTEERVARLVASGQSSPQVAAALGLSRSTVEWHLWHVYRKLGTRSRAELAGLLAGSAAVEAGRDEAPGRDRSRHVCGGRLGLEGDANRIRAVWRADDARTTRNGRSER
jgi:DNA-binding CsgD family transcriptional regulator